ncbi:MAG: hypothetical protein GX182_08510 [Firmicutes bacterium]|jgi:spore germination cell wall hydrolase CwlJ-like protein|nr:hypothetical protein [Bacillota bacterium]
MMGMTVEWEVAPEEAAQLAGRVRLANSQYLLRPILVLVNGKKVPVKDGRFELSTYPGHVDLEVEAKYYQPHRQELFLDEGLNEIDIMLEPAFSWAELDLFARLVHAESAGEPYAGQVAVAASVLHRLESPAYPDTIRGVIYQVTDGRYYQYSPVLDGRINLPANRTSFQAVYDALAGWDPSGGATGFYNPRKTSNRWVRSRPVTATIGRHVFFR